ncbi:Na+/H+ antiporter NhaC [Chromohalobacter nigrandesensis]|uniref:Na+/H+ antiporter NhaC n=1 Tax=Chromohalobacter nigrandesensis TaxID=119863 RepID=UPI001FF5E0D7|nr:Na+/H+ antiporter NhaC [Chromohalobacter nigrandesensis]MCK0744340.1 Na+/H+ antiporter NhaC [Chromohalobacter nigrandesensis]
MKNETQPIALPSLGMALLPILLTIGLLAIQLFYYGDFTPHIPLALGAAIAAIFGWARGYRWQEMQAGGFKLLHVAMPAVATLIVVGMLIGVLISSGTVPTLIYYGLELLSPQWFLAATMLMCAVVSLVVGSSWTTVGTVGLALMGIGIALEVPVYWTAGAIVSGAFFGDKMSPLSDTTNLSPAVTETNIFDHIKNMLPTTVPAMLIALVIYAWAGGGDPEGASSLARIADIREGLTDAFQLGFWQLIPLLVILTLAFLKIAPIPALFTATCLGGVIAMLTQGVSFHDVLTYAHSGYTVDTGIGPLDTLLNRGGVTSMTWVVTLIIFALIFGGILEKTRCLEKVVTTITEKARSFRALQTSAVLTPIFVNTIAGDVYLSIALPGRMYVSAYDRLGYSRLNLSRAIEEGGTLVSPLIPWNVGGAFVMTTLGLTVSDGDLSALLYIPFAFACWLSPLISIIYAQLGLFSHKADPEKRPNSDQPARLSSQDEGEGPIPPGDENIALQNSGTS